MSKSTNGLPLEQRQIIFRALVESQDSGLSPNDSRAAIAQKFSIPLDQVKEIEREGLDNQWPPL